MKLRTLSLLFLSALATGLMSAPLLAVSQADSHGKTFIEAPSHKKMGAGLVLLVTLQRS